jgi:hypothetical protein
MLFIGSKNRKKFFDYWLFLKHLNDIIFVYVCVCGYTPYYEKNNMPPNLAIEE